MKKETRILTREDTGVIPVFLDIFHKRLREIEPFYEGTPIIQESREKFTPKYIESCLRGEQNGSRFIGHFRNGDLAGLLIEGFRTEEYKGEHFPLTVLAWVMANQDGQGVGGELIEDCLKRAKTERKAGVQLMYAIRNPAPLVKIYKGKGFEEPFDHENYIGIIKLMNYRVK